MHRCCAVSLQSSCQSVQSHIDLHAPSWLHRAKSYTLQNLTPRTGTPSSPFPESVFLQSEQTCGDQRPQHRGALTEIPPLTGYEPNRIAEAWDYRHFTGDGQFTEQEDLRVRPLFFHKLIIAEARSELMKQEYKVASLNTCISELEQQPYVLRLKLEDARVGYVESPREQVRLQEDLVTKEKALRDTQIRSFHAMGELKRAQELRVD